ncbi:MAG: RelA/SpoT family protein [Alphaproteobacteria bacterium]
MLRQFELVERVCHYDPDADEALLNRAYVFAVNAHGKQTRASGDPYYSHPVEVAGILTDLRLDTCTIATALLHDTVEDTDVTTDDIEEHFGAEIAELVDGVTKLSKLELNSEETKQAENFRKLLLAMSKDVRVLLVKLADRLHNMRTLHHISKPEKRVRISQETMEIYAPLAGLIGMQDFRDELEDLAFMHINPAARESIVKRLDFLAAHAGDVIERITARLEALLIHHGIEASIKGRAKRPYSIWRKMEGKQISFEQLADVFGFRVVVRTLEDCYRGLGVFHTEWSFVPGRFKDYISTPKRNDYQSIHTTVIGPERQRVEIQIRTAEMDAIAERGVAAHWAYKDAGGRGFSRASETRGFKTLRNIASLIEHGAGPEELLENTKLEMFSDQVFCFTPKGTLIALPRGATVVDFAYAVHTDLGDTCVGAKINGHHRPLRTRLQNGDMVEIVRSEAQTPHADWDRFVVTGKAKASIRRFVRQSRREQFIRLGRSLTERYFQTYERDLTDKGVEQALSKLKRSRIDDVFADVGMAELAPELVFRAVYPGVEIEVTEEGAKAITAKKAPARVGHGSPSGPMPIKGLIPGIAVHLGQCCHPLPGDRIVGIMSAGEGMVVHTIDCEVLGLYHEAPERWVDLAWDPAPTDGSETHVPVARLDVLITHTPGALGALSTIIAQHGGNISNLRITDRTPLYFEIILDVDVEDVKHLTQIMAALRASDLVESVDRPRG